MGNYDDNDLDYHLGHGETVEPVGFVRAINQLGSHWQEFFAKPREKELRQRNEAKDHFATLIKAARLLDMRLKQSGSPFRFCVYEKDGEILVEMIQIDSKGNVCGDSLKNITHDEFYKWVADFDAGEGLLFDESA